MKNKYLVIGLILVLLSAITGCINKTSVESQDPNRYISIEYSVDFNKTFSGSLAPEGKQYLITKINIQNHGYETFDTHPIQWSLTYDNVKGYKPTLDTKMPILNLLDGGKAEGVIAFEVPESSSRSYALNYQGVKGNGILGKMSCVNKEGEKCYIDYNIKWKNIN